MSENVFIVGDQFGYPVGRATISRVRNIALGLKANDIECKVLIISPSENRGNVKNSAVHGFSDGIEFFYSTKSTIKSGSKFKPMYDNVIGLMRSLKFLYLRKKNGELDYAILYLRKTYTILILGVFLRWIGIKTAVELCEWHLAFPSKTKYHRYLRVLFSKNVFRWTDGAILISQFLVDKFNEFQNGKKRKRNGILLPILVDFDKFPKSEIYKHNHRFLFCGQLDYFELIEFLLKSFAKVFSSNPDSTLYIVGDAENSKNFRRITELVTELGIEKAVMFTGFVTDSELLDLYHNSEALLLPLPPDNRSKARFPTKIGEYLSVGKPVIISKEGDIQNYLVDNQSCYFVNSFTHEEFAHRMLDCLNDFEMSKAIGSAGRKVAEEIFDPINRGRSLRAFLRAL